VSDLPANSTLAAETDLRAMGYRPVARTVEFGLMYNRTIVVHTGVVRSANKIVRQSVSLPVNVAAQVRSLAKTRRLSSNRMLVELIENGIEAEKRKRQEFFQLAELFRNATDPEEAKRLGNRLGRMVFSG
jgi:hypothetical protein